MRTAFINQLCELAQQDERIWLVCGDVGYSVLEVFAQAFPHRFLNAGVAEQNMTGVAAGLALAGKVVFTYSIANFPVMRCFEQIRNDVCYHNLNVKIVAVGGGFAYGSNGYTHHGVEDLAVISTLPNMVVAAPADPIETQAIARMFANMPGPGYLRLGKVGEPALHLPDKTIEFGKAVEVCPGEYCTIMSTGSILATVLTAVESAHSVGLRPRVLSMPFIVPLDQDAILKASHETGGIITVEEHGPGGLGTAVAECLILHQVGIPFFPVRLNKTATKWAGTQEELRAVDGLNKDGIFRAIMNLI